MTIARRTVIAHGRLAIRELRLNAARKRRHGLQIMTFEQLAARLAGGLVRPVDDETLRTTIQDLLPKISLGELDSLKSLPGMVSATVDTLRKAWRAGIDLQARAKDHKRLASIASLEKAVLAALPPAMMRPVDIVTSALQRLDHVENLFGPIEIVGITELSPCWRPLLHAIASRTSVSWIAGPRSVPSWLDEQVIDIRRSDPEQPNTVTVSASTAYHEAIEAMRWARQLLASGKAEPSDIAIASSSPADYDDYFLALRADANLDLHFVHGVKVTTCREGQTAAALADILVRGLSQVRVRRLARLLAATPGPFQKLPQGWMRSDAPLTSPQAWLRLIDRLQASDWPDGTDHKPALREIISLLSEGPEAAETIGATLLSGKSLAIWRKALLAGPAASLDQTLESLKQDDGLEACVSIAWMPASALAASPRRFVYLLGLNSSRWPRGIAEDRLLSDHIISTRELDPLPVNAADRRDFDTILKTTRDQVVLSRARRDSDGRLLGRSTLLHGQPEETYLRRNRVPEHAFSESDRLTARPTEFRALPQAKAAAICWSNWQSSKLTPHDGLVRPDHPAIKAILERTHSATSLTKLLRNPLGFVWHYGLKWSEPESGEDPLVLDPLAVGNLVHTTLDHALRRLEANGGLANASTDQINDAVNDAANKVAETWETEQSVPPRIIWQRTLDDVRELSRRSLAFKDQTIPGARAYGEVPFGGSELRDNDASPPWDFTIPVEIPGTGFRIKGYIDRLDVSGDGRKAMVRDYKTGRKPKDDIVLNGGKELQRCLYAFAVRAMLGDHVEISASLFYPLDEADLPLADPKNALTDITGYLIAARDNLLKGGSVPGDATGDGHDDLAFALPANARATYFKRKIAAAMVHLGPAVRVWDAN